MAEKSNIEWTDSTFNPWIGCTKVSPGCDHCYAARQDNFRHWTAEGWGGPRKRTSEATWRLPTLWNKHGFVACRKCDWRGERSECVDFGDTCPRCDGLVQNTRRRVFCASLADVFDNQVPPEWRADLFALIDATPNLDWLLLTKRIGNVNDMLRQILRPDTMPPNVWLGATVVNQEEADRDIPKLLATPARVRFLSMEPLLGPVNLSRWLWACCGNTTTGGEYMGQREEVCCGNPEPRDVLDWVIAGGESGPKARPMHPDWARSLRDQCAAAGVPFLFKQWGEFLPASADLADPTIADVPDSRLFWSDGEKWDRFDGQRAGVDLVARVGKKAAGRLLDGVTHDGFPEVQP